MLRNSNYLFNQDKNFIPSKLHLGDFLIMKFKEFGDKIALVSGATDSPLTYNDILQASMNIAVSLTQLGLKKGETVGICSETRLENWSVIVGAICDVGVMTPLSIGYVKATTCKMLKHPNYLFGPDDCVMPVKINLGDFLVKGFKRHGDKVAVINAVTEQHITYNEMVQAAMNLAVSLVRLGVKKGDVVGICAESRLENWPTVLGLICTGAVITPFSTAYVKDELKHVINISRPSYLFCSKEAYQVHKAVFKSLEYIKEIIFFDDDRPKGTLFYGDLATVSPRSIIEENVKIEDFLAVEVDGGTETAFIMYSSGTTGLPKGVMISHLNLIALCSAPDVCDPKFNVLQITPWYHSMGLMVMLLYMYCGSLLVFLPKFELDFYLRSIEKYKIKKLLLVPTVLLAISKTPFTYDVSSVKVIVSGAAVLHHDLIQAVKSKFENLIDVYQGYGMTEATVLVSLASYINRKKCKPGSVGMVHYNTTIKIVDVETRKPLCSYQTGEICFKSPTLMRGYVGKEKGEDFDEDGFFKTGDIGYYDDEKYLFIVDRLKELIKYKGYQVPPAEIEMLLLQHPGVRDVGVVGLPDAMAGEVPLAFVVPQPDACLKEAELIEFVADRLSNPKHLRGGVRFVKEIPRNPTGKILRKSLRDMLEDEKKD